MAKVIYACEIYVRRIKFSGFYAPKIKSFSEMKKDFSEKLISTSLVKASESNSTKKTGVFLTKKGFRDADLLNLFFFTSSIVRKGRTRSPHGTD